MAAVAFWSLALAAAGLALRGQRAQPGRRDPIVAPLAMAALGTVVLSVFIGVLLLVPIASVG